MAAWGDGGSESLSADLRRLSWDVLRGGYDEFLTLPERLGSPAAGLRTQSNRRGLMRLREILIVPPLEGALILVVGLAGYISHSPLLFASLGPTAFEMIETPHRKSARPYNIIGGHLIGILAAFAALWLTNARNFPSVSAAGVPLVRVWAAALAAMLTALGTFLARARQPAALSTTLLVSLGVLQTARDGVVIMAAVLMMTALGEPIRRLRRRDLAPAERSDV